MATKKLQRRPFESVSSFNKRKKKQKEKNDPHFSTVLKKAAATSRRHISVDDKTFTFTGILDQLKRDASVIIKEKDTVALPFKNASFCASGAVSLSKEEVNHPAHYGGEEDPYEAIKVIEAWELGFRLGSVLKYINRSGRKDDKLKDLKKAAWYLNREIQKMKI